MHTQEEKIFNIAKLTILFLITLLGVCLTSEVFMMVLLLFYIAFIKD